MQQAQIQVFKVSNSFVFQHHPKNSDKVEDFYYTPLNHISLREIGRYISIF